MSVVADIIRRRGAATVQMALPLDAPHARRRFDHGHALYLGLHVAGGLASTLLMTWGAMVFAFLAISTFSLDGLMHHMANLSTRYVAADGPRISGFKSVVTIAHVLLFCAILFFRRHALLPARRSNAHG